MSANPQVDELVPPPWSPGRRLAATAAVATLVAAAIVVWWSGVVAPRLDVEIIGGNWQEGAVIDDRVTDVTITVVLEIRNRGWRAATVTGWTPPDTSGIAWSGHVDPSPVEIPPGEQAEVEISLGVADCRQVDGRGVDSIILNARGALPVAVPRSVPLEPHALGLPHDLDTGAMRTGREPSWVYHVLSWPCDPDVIEDAG